MVRLSMASFKLTAVEDLGILHVADSSHITPQEPVHSWHQPGTLGQWSKTPCSYSSRSLD